MTKPELGTKRLCTECGARYYDLNTTPIACPKCGAPFRLVETATPNRLGQRPAARQPDAPRKTDSTSPDPPDTLIEELDEDDADVSEIIGETDEKDQEDT